MAFEEWDPHTGDIRRLSSEMVRKDTPDQFFTRAKLDLKPYHSCFLVEAAIEK